MEYFKLNGKFIALGKSRQSVRILDRAKGVGPYNVIECPCFAKHVPNIAKMRKYNFFTRGQALKFYSQLRKKYIGESANDK